MLSKNNNPKLASPRNAQAGDIPWIHMDTVAIHGLKDKALAICFLIFLNMWVFILARN